MPRARSSRSASARTVTAHRRADVAVSIAPAPSGRRVLLVPVALSLALFLLSFVPRVSSSPVVTQSFWAATGALLVWSVVLFLRVKRAGEGRSFEIVLRSQHYVQALVQGTVITFWAWYWPQAAQHAWLLVAQLVFAYAFDMLLAWSRRRSYVLGFGPFPIIFSTNLFLWFRDDWFYLQFVMLAVGFIGKEFVRWQRDGRSVHIFNPSAFSLGLFSLVLIVTETTHLTWGPQIATTLHLIPKAYLLLFLLGLIAMFFFSTTLLSAFAAAVLFGLSALYMQLTGVPYFVDSEIPIAVFLGLHLLVTDPSTSPKTPLGRLIFGVLYGLGVFVLYELLSTLGAPTFYDKLLCVPLLNLSVRRIDRLTRALGQRALVTRAGLHAFSRPANVAHMAAWIVFFGVMTSLGATDGRHPGDSVPFWQTACDEGRRKACETLLFIESVYCGEGSGWACNEVGLHYTEAEIVPRDTELARVRFSRACELAFRPGCLNSLGFGGLSRAEPRVIDLRLLLREGKANLLDSSPQDLYARACDHGWIFACSRTGG